MARAYRDALEREAPDVCRFLDRQFVDDWGQQWLNVIPTAGIDLDEWVTVDVAAQHVGLTAKSVYAWIYADKITPHRCNDGRVRVQLGEAVNHNARLRQRRAARGASDTAA